MPELPEVETVRRGLEAVATGRLVKEVTVTGRRTIRRQTQAEFIERLSGRRISTLRRRGKYLLVDLDDGAVLLVHLRMSGQLRHLSSNAPTDPHTHVVLVLEDGSELRFVDPRTFGELFVTDELDGDRLPLVLSGLGPDALLAAPSREMLARKLGTRRTSLKAFLLDQRVIAGIGNIYADEICSVARLAPTRRTESLQAREVGRLSRAVPTVLGAAVKLGGSSLRDARYRDLFGGLGGFQVHHAVHARSGEPCKRCRTPIEHLRLAGRSTYFCPRCQT